MINYYKERFKKIVLVINSDVIKECAHPDNFKSFTRKRKMPLEATESEIAKEIPYIMMKLENPN